MAKKAAINEPQAEKEVLCSPYTRTTLQMEAILDIDNVHLEYGTSPDNFELESGGSF